MPTISVLKDGEMVTTVEFRGQFMIVEKDDHLLWKADNELAKSGGGEIHIWILLKPDGIYYIAFVRPDWTLVIDGVVYESRLYQDVPLSEGEVELRYRDYRFIHH